MADIITNGIGMKLVLIPAGSFTMGGDMEKEQADENENPRHRVTFETPFYMGRHAVTQSQWKNVMGTDPSQFKGENRPVEMVSHQDALEFIARLNEMESTRANRLPSEAQWEYAARAGSQEAWCFGSQRMKLGQYAWYKKNSNQMTHPAGLLSPNDWGLCDMHGNVHEWCSDWFDRNYYAKSPSCGPEGPDNGFARALRGGDWGSEDWYCRCASRSLSSPERRSPRVGFRIIKLSQFET